MTIAFGAYTASFRADFSGTSFGAAATWTDISADLLAVGDDGDITGGRQQWEGSVTGTTLSFTLDNALGHYTPGLASSPYYPNVVRNVRVQLYITISGTPYYLFDGYVNSWVAEFEGNKYSTCEINASDMSARMSNSTQMRGFLTEEILLDIPPFLYPMQEAEGATSFGDITGQAQPATIVNSKYGAGSVDAGQTATGNFVAGDMVSVTNDAYATWTTGPVAGSALVLPVNATLTTLEMWTQPSSAPPASAAVLGYWAQPGSAAGYAALQVNSNGSIQFVAGGGTLLISGPNVFPFDGASHEVVLDVAPNPIVVYIDGVVVASNFGGGLTLPITNLYLGLAIFGYGGDGLSQQPYTGGYAFVTGFTSSPGPTRIKAHYNAGANCFAGETTSAHFARILSYRPNLGSVIDTTLGFVGSGDIGNAPVVGDDGEVSGDNEQDDLQACADAEGGITYTDGQGRQVLRSRSRLFNPTSVLTLDASKPQVDVSTTFAADTQNAMNDVTATRVNGAANRYYDPVAVEGPDGDLTSSVTVNVDTDQDALDIAGWMVATGKNTAPYSPNVVVDLLGETSTSVVAAVLQLAPFDVITLTNLPAIAPASSVSLMVQGWRYTVGQDQFTAEFYTSPLPPAVGVWDTSLWDATSDVFAY